MDKLSRADRKLLQLMLEQKLITEIQEGRVRLAMKRGQTLSDALWHTPLVDPVKFASLQAYAAHEEERSSSSREVRKLSSSGAHKLPDFEPIHGEDDDLDIALDLDLDPPPESSPVEGYELKSLGPVGEADEDGSGPVELPDLDFDPDMDMDLDLDGEEPRAAIPAPAQTEKETPSPPPPAPSPPSVKRPQAPAPEPPAVAATEKKKKETNRPPSLAELRGRVSGSIPHETANSGSLEGEIDSALDEAFTGQEKGKGGTTKPRPSEVLPPPDAAESYQPRAGQVHTYDLAEDEGISLIQQTNELLQESLRAGDAAIRLYAGEVEGPNLVHYTKDRSRRDALERPVADLEKLSNRLKVMGRLESWRRQQAQKGTFNIRWEGRERRVLLDFAPDGEGGGGEILTVHLLDG